MDLSIVTQWAYKLYDAVIWCINLLPKTFDTYSAVGTEIAKSINEPESGEAFALLIFAGFVLITYLGIKKYFDPARNMLAFFGIILVILVLVALIFVPSISTT